MLHLHKSLMRAGLAAVGLSLALAALVPATATAAVAAVSATPIVATAGDVTMTIAEARRQPVGATVSIMGSVTVPSGTFSSSFGDEGFAVQDSTGGIYVSVADNLNLQLRQRVKVSGKIADSAGLIQVVPASDGDVTALGKGFPVRPRWERTHNVGPANQGLLVEVVGIITEDIEPDPPYGMKIELSDGSGPIRVFINTSANIDISGLARGDLLRVVGFSSAYDTPEIDPRFQSDLIQPKKP